MRTPLAILPLLALLAAAAWLLALIVAPLTLPAGTVVGLHGEANRLDFPDRWTALDPFHGIVYAVGDLLCHQKVHRSLLLGGNQLPVDARMTAIFAAAVVGLGLAARPGLPRERWLLGDALWDAARGPAARRPRDPRVRAVIGLGLVAAALLPAAVDVAAQALLGYESTNGLRLATGTLAGVAGGLTLGASLRVAETVGRALASRGRVSP